MKINKKIFSIILTIFHSSCSFKHERDTLNPTDIFDSQETSKYYQLTNKPENSSLGLIEVFLLNKKNQRCLGANDQEIISGDCDLNAIFSINILPRDEHNQIAFQDGTCLEFNSRLENLLSKNYCKNNTTQHFLISPSTLNPDFSTISYDDLCLTEKNNQSRPTLEKCRDSDEQLFKITRLTKFKNEKTNKCLQITESGTVIQDECRDRKKEQVFQIEETEIPNQFTIITSKNLCLEARQRSNGEKIKETICTETPYQRFFFRYTIDQPNYTAITSSFNSKCIDIEHQSNNAGANAHFWSCFDNTVTQKFKHDLNYQTTHIQHIDSKKCLSSSSTSSHHSLILNKCSESIESDFYLSAADKNNFYIKNIYGECLSNVTINNKNRLKFLTCDSSHTFVFNKNFDLNNHASISPSNNLNLCININTDMVNVNTEINLKTCKNTKNQIFQIDQFGSYIFSTKIINTSNGRCLKEVEDGNIVHGGCDTPESLFSFYELNSFSYQIKTPSGKCLEIEENNLNDGQKPKTNICQNKPGQVFKAPNLKHGETTIISHLSGKCLDIDGQKSDLNAAIHQWECYPNLITQKYLAITRPEMQVWIRSISLDYLGKCLNINQKNNFEFSQCTDSLASSIQLKSVGQGYYQITIPNIFKCAEIDQFSQEDKKTISLAKCTGWPEWPDASSEKPNQLVQFIWSSKNLSYQIQFIHSKKCLTVEDDVALQTACDSNNLEQLFKIERPAKLGLKFDRDLLGYDSDGYDSNDFDRRGFHRLSRKKFDLDGFDRKNQALSGLPNFTKLNPRGEPLQTENLHTISTIKLLSDRIPKNLRFNIYLILIDTLREDVIEHNMPNLYKFKSESISSEKSISTGTATELSVFSMLHSRPAWDMSRFPKENNFLGSLPLAILKYSLGYRIFGGGIWNVSCQFSKPYSIFNKWGNPSHNTAIQTNFGLYSHLFSSCNSDGFIGNESYNGTPNWDLVENGRLGYEQFKQHISKNQVPYGQFFFLHAAGTHHPVESTTVTYEKVPDEFRAPNGINRNAWWNYIQRAKLEDSMLGSTLDKLKEQNLYDPSLIIIFSDHGEEFFADKKQGFHGLKEINKEQTYVPIYYKIPKNIQIQNEPVEISSTTDIFPTIFSLLGIYNEIYMLPLIHKEWIGRPIFDQRERIIPTRTYNTNAVTFYAGQYKLMTKLILPGKTYHNDTYWQNITNIDENNFTVEDLQTIDDVHLERHEICNYIRTNTVANPENKWANFEQLYPNLLKKLSNKMNC